MALGKRGKKLLKSLAPEGSSDATAALAMEAARIADRLDELDRIIAGKGVLELMRFRLKDLFSDEDDRNVSVEVRFDNVLSEARQQAAALNTLLKTLGLEAASAAPSKRPAAAPTVTDGSSAGGGGIESLAARRAERESRRRAASQD